jgi:toxin ParE1/3/4
MAAYLLSPRAQRSLVQISQYTFDNVGERQKKRYLKILRECMRSAAKNPEKGKVRDDIKTGYYSLQAEKHNIYYRIRNSHIEVIDVLHQSMEPNIHIG